VKPSSVIGRRSSVLPILVGVLLGVACGGSGNSGNGARGSSDTLTERQRDSILSKSKIPGASGVGRAMNAADSASARNQAADTVQ
jgi:hypothetical protein